MLSPLSPTKEIFFFAAGFWLVFLLVKYTIYFNATHSIYLKFTQNVLEMHSNRTISSLKSLQPSTCCFLVDLPLAPATFLLDCCWEVGN